jgi:hypothetical protein
MAQYAPPPKKKDYNMTAFKMIIAVSMLAGCAFAEIDINRKRGRTRHCKHRSD